MIKAVLQSLKTGGLDLTASEYADLIWLAAQMSGAQAPIETGHSVSPPSLLDGGPPMPPTPPEDSKDAPPDQPGTPAPKPGADRPPQIHLPRHSPASPEPIQGLRAVSIRVPAARALAQKLEIGRSLRPLLRRKPSRTELVLDEDLSAERLADCGPTAPAGWQLAGLVFRPLPTRWRDLALVVDESPTMVIWRQTIAEFQELLAQLGAFRRIVTYSLVTNRDSSGDVELSIRTRVGQGQDRGRICDPREVVDPGQSRLILVLSNCSTSAWQQGAAAKLLQGWAGHNLVTIVQMLPEQLWASCALHLALQVRLSALAPCTNNQQLKFELPWYWTESNPPEGLPIPVVTLQPESLSAWARLVTGHGQARLAGVFLPAAPVEREPESDERLEAQPADLLQRFRLTASPTARELAGYLAAAPLSLPVMRLVQAAMLPQSRQVHLAEVFRSGLIKRLTPYEPSINPDEILYDFVEGVRERLLPSVLVSDTRKVLEEVSKYIGSRHPQIRSFHALVVDPTAPGEFVLDEESRPFAEVAISVLRRLGKQYAALVKRLEDSIEEFTGELEKGEPGGATSPSIVFPKAKTLLPPPIRILVVENDPQQRMDYLELMRGWQYQCFIAEASADADDPHRSLLEDAVQKAHRHRCHIALVDLRLRDDSDSGDMSGLSLVPELAPAMSIILSGHVSIRTVRNALISPSTPPNRPCDFLGKEEGPEALREAIREVERNFLHRRPVEFVWQPGLQPETLMRPFYSDHSGEYDAPQDEIEDIFCRLFPQARRLRIESLTRFAYSPAFSTYRRSSIVRVLEDNRARPVIVKLGPPGRISEEANRFANVEQDFHSVRYARPLGQPVELWNVGGIIYEQIGDLKGPPPVPFSEHYRTHVSRDIIEALLSFQRFWRNLYHRSPKERISVFLAYSQLWGDYWTTEMFRHQDNRLLKSYPREFRSKALPDPFTWMTERLQLTASGAYRDSIAPIVFDKRKGYQLIIEKGTTLANPSK